MQQCLLLHKYASTYACMTDFLCIYGSVYVCLRKCASTYAYLYDFIFI